MVEEDRRILDAMARELCDGLRALYPEALAG